MHLRRHGNLERTIMATPIPASSILDALPSEVSRGLFAQGRSVSLDAEQTLFLAGDKGDGCYRVEEGLLKASVGAPNGSERILGILGPGSVVGELSMIDGAPRSASVTALRDSKLYFVSQADFDAIVLLVLLILTSTCGPWPVPAKSDMLFGTIPLFRFPR
jgi:CRP-like cAMP-binding protein